MGAMDGVITGADQWPTPRKDEPSAEMNRRFSTHEIIGEQKAMTVVVRERCKALGTLIEKSTRPGREQQLALTKLEEVMFWANAAIARPPQARPQWTAEDRQKHIDKG